MKHRVGRVLLGLFALGLGVATATAAGAVPLSLSSDAREVAVTAEICDPSCDEFDFVAKQGIPGSPFADFQEDLVVPGYQATQTSTIHGTRLAGNGLAQFDESLVDDPPVNPGWRPADNGSANSFFEVEFDVLGATSIVLNGRLSIGSGFPGSNVSSSFALRSGSNVLSELTVGGDTASDPYGAYPFSFAGILMPGTYTLAAQSLAGDRIDGVGTWQFELTVPEPGTGLLIGVGMVFLFRRRSRAGSA